MRNMLTSPTARLLLGLVACILLAETAHGQSWWDVDWNRRVKLTFKSSALGGNLTDFPVLVTLNGARIDYDDTRDAGEDIRFIDDDGTTELKHQIEMWDEAGTSWVWVKVAQVDGPSSTDHIWMYYDNPSAVDTQDASAVWSNGYVSVWHLAETTGTVLVDNVSGNDAVKLSLGEPAATTGGRIDGAQDFDGTDDVATAPDDASLDLTNTGTMEVWISVDDTTSAESAFSGWTGLAPPTGSGIEDGNDGVDLTVVGQKIYYAALLHDDATESFYTANSNLDGTAFTGWTSQTAPDGAGDVETVSIAIDSDGDNLYYAAFLHDGATESFYTASSNLDGTGFSGWTSRTAPDGTAPDDRSGIDMTIVDGTMYFAASLHDDNAESFHTANMPLAGGPVTWTSQSAPNGVGSNETTSVGIDSDGSTLYYAAFNHQNEQERFYTASSSLDGTGFSAWTTQTSPAGAGRDDASFIDMTVVGDRMYFSALMLRDSAETFQTANANLDGTGFSGWTTRAAPSGGGPEESVVASVATDGKKLYYAAFLHSGSTGSFAIASSTVTAHPVISKAHAYELIQTGGGFVLDWEGSPKSFGSITVSTPAHVAITHDGTTMIYYVDGVEQRRQTAAQDFLSNSSAVDLGGGGTFFDGILDEVRISSVARSGDWITANHKSMIDDFITYGSSTAVRAFYWADVGNDTIERAEEDGVNRESVRATGLTDSSRLTIDATVGRIYWTDYGTARIQRMNLNGTNRVDVITTGLAYPRGITVDSSGGKLYWTDPGALKIQRANLDGTTVEDVVTFLTDPRGIRVDSSGGKIYWTDAGTDKIQRADLDGSTIEDLVTGADIGHVLDLALDVAGAKMYWVDSIQDKIKRANLDGSSIEELITTGLDDPRGIELDVARGKMYWTDVGTKKVQRANLDGSTVEDLVTTSLDTPVGIATGLGGVGGIGPASEVVAWHELEPQ